MNLFFDEPRVDIEQPLLFSSIVGTEWMSSKKEKWKKAEREDSTLQDAGKNSSCSKRAFIHILMIVHNLRPCKGAQDSSG
jgi:hypothetical protein